MLNIFVKSIQYWRIHFMSESILITIINLFMLISYITYRTSNVNLQICNSLTHSGIYNVLLMKPFNWAKFHIHSKFSSISINAFTYHLPNQFLKPSYHTTIIHHLCFMNSMFESYHHQIHVIRILKVYSSIYYYVSYTKHMSKLRIRNQFICHLFD